MRLNSLTTLLLAAIAMAVFATNGCDSPPDGGSGSPSSGGAHNDHGHSHDDDHADDHPAHGPFGGHIFALDSPDYQAEWKKYNDNDIIRMYVLDAAEKKAVPIKADSFTVTPMVGNDDIQFELAAEEPDDDGKSAVYMLDDKDLTIAIPLGVKISIQMGDQTVSGEIKAHKPLDH